jgi:hypothetical protein
MLVRKDEASQMYCPFKFSHSASREAGHMNPEWRCEGLKCMAWQKHEIPVPGEHGYCALAGKPEEIDKKRT